MPATRVLVVVMTPGLALLLAGCAGRGGSDGAGGFGAGGSPSATEERTLTAPHVPGSGLDVHTDVGSVEVVADPAAEGVTVTATVTAFADTDEQAKARLPDIKVQVGRRDDRVLA